MTSLSTDLTSLREHVAAWRAAGKRVALVPTMGALHAGHLALVTAAREIADRVIVTIFVNPKQFAPSEDFAAYPRDLEADRAAVDAAGADLVYAPEVATIYPEGFSTTVSVAGPAAVGLEDRFRPTHFAGVATVVLKLLMQVQPDVALFGEKDYQQLRMIENMVRDLDVPIAIVGIETVREADGLALSSRNVYLDPDQRARAPVLHEVLARCVRAVGQGTPVDVALADARRRAERSGFVVDYIEARDATSLSSLAPNRDGRILAAARLGRTRLIDNVPLGVGRSPLPSGRKTTG